MLLQDKIKHLRLTEGLVRGLGREMSKAEVLRAMQDELGQSVSHAYMCQLESGARDHMSPGTRSLLAGFFKVHPGYLVSDPPGYQEELTVPLRQVDLIQSGVTGVGTSGPQAPGGSPRLRAGRLFERVLKHEESERYLALIEKLLEFPDLAGRLHDVLKDMTAGD